MTIKKIIIKTIIFKKYIDKKMIGEKIKDKKKIIKNIKMEEWNYGRKKRTTDYNASNNFKPSR